MSYPLRAVAAVTALGLAGAVVWTVGSDSSNDEADRDPVNLERIANIALTTQHNCDDLLAYYRKEATKVVGPYGLDGGPQLYASAERATDSLAAGKSAAPSAVRAAGDSGTPDSGTNVQVAGVDESDIVKTSGDIMVAVINGEIQITRLAGAKTTKLATWRPSEGMAQSILLDGSTAVVLGDRNGGIPLGETKLRDPGAEGYSAAVTDLTVLDLADPANPSPVRRLELTGTRSGEARLVDGELRFALNATANGITWKRPVYPDLTDRDLEKAQTEFKKREDEATRANQKLIAKSSLANWIPEATVTPLGTDGKPSGAGTSRPLIDCGQVAIPGTFSGLSTLALVSTDLHADEPLTTWKSAGVIAAGSTLYATADHVWLATSRWDAVRPTAQSSFVSRFAPSATSTRIHRFDTPRHEQPKYLASGEVAGSLLNQFAMDEKDGLLRVASTTEGVSTPPIPIEDSAGDTSVSSGGTDSGVASDGAEGDLGTNPNQTASNPTSPSTTSPSAAAPSAGTSNSAAEKPVTPVTPKILPSSVAPKGKLSEGRVTVLKVDGDRLVQAGVVTGLGRGERIRGVRFIDEVGYVVTYRQTDPLYTVDLSDPAKPRVRGELAVLGYSAYLHPAGEGRLLGLGQDGTETGRTTGTQLSLFDVSNLDSPTRLDRARMADAWSSAENDHHAFTMAGDLVLIPYTSWTSQQGPSPKTGVAPDGHYEERFDAGVIAIKVGKDELGAPTTLRPIADGPITLAGPEGQGRSPSAKQTTLATPMRTVVHAGTIYTLTAIGVAAHSTADFDRLTFATF